MELEQFPFGKYKGKTIEEIPTTYLAFAIESFNLPEDYINKMRIEVFNRLKIDEALWDIQADATAAALDVYKGEYYTNFLEVYMDNARNALCLVIDCAFEEMRKKINPQYDQE